jgi:hypothetical protein
MARCRQLCLPCASLPPAPAPMCASLAQAGSRLVLGIMASGVDSERKSASQRTIAWCENLSNQIRLTVC